MNQEKPDPEPGEIAADAGPAVSDESAPAAIAPGAGFSEPSAAAMFPAGTPAAAAAAQDVPAAPFSRVEVQRLVEAAAARFPGRSERTELVLLDVDPHRLHAYWTIDRETLNAALRALGSAGPQGPMILRFEELGADGAVAEAFDVPVHGFKNAWYVDIWRDGCSYRAALGMRGSDGAMVWLARSNRIAVPPARPSAETGLDWLTVEQMPTTRSLFPELHERVPPPQDDALFAALFPAIAGPPEPVAAPIAARGAGDEAEPAAAAPETVPAGRAIGIPGGDGAAVGMADSALETAIGQVEATLSASGAGQGGDMAAAADIAVGAPQTPHHRVARLPEALGAQGPGVAGARVAAETAGPLPPGFEITPETLQAVVTGGDVQTGLAAPGAPAGGNGVLRNGGAPLLVQEGLRRVFPNVLEEEEPGAEAPPGWAQAAAQDGARAGNGFAEAHVGGPGGNGTHPGPAWQPGPQNGHAVEGRGPESGPGHGADQALPLESILSLSSFQFGREDIQLEMNAELHIYGRANPDSKLSLFGQRLRLRPDGSFSIRRPLPHGALVIPLLLNPGLGVGEPGDP
ncbi:MAG: DUF4912 domain-containing protein [Alphaproteobacteria bacterium]|nr:DUF4912 domain-containing protein [Alphaproteobacteria bacterium]